jgi:hypothetical protein
MCKKCYKFVKNSPTKFVLIFFSPILSILQVSFKKFDSECLQKRDVPKYIVKKLQLSEMSKLQIFVITNICKPKFVNFGRIGTRSP